MYYLWSSVESLPYLGLGKLKCLNIDHAYSVNLSAKMPLSTLSAGRTCRRDVDHQSRTEIIK